MSLLNNNTTTNAENSKFDLAFNMSKSIGKDFVEYAYRGMFSEDITLKILNLTNAKFVNNKATFKKQRRISYFLIETLQNVVRHGDTSSAKYFNNESLLVIQKTTNSVFITTANVIKNSRIPKLEKYLVDIKSFSKEKLDAEFNKILLNGEISEKGGGGIGLLTMARRTSGKIDSYFKKINDKYSYYFYQIEVVFGENTITDDNIEKVSLKRISKLFDLLTKENILLNFNGTFAFDNLQNILPFIEAHSVGSEDLKDKIYDISINTLKNIINYADDFTEDGEAEAQGNGKGIFTLCKNNENIYLNAGNIIANDKTFVLKNKIDIINNTEFKSLNKIKKYLDNFYSETTHNQPDISLIDMKIKNKSNINYIFKEINSKISYFILQFKM